jgi:hypothetical protein
MAVLEYDILYRHSPGKTAVSHEETFIDYKMSVSAIVNLLSEGIQHATAMKTCL